MPRRVFFCLSGIRSEHTKHTHFRKLDLFSSSSEQLEINFVLGPVENSEISHSETSVSISPAIHWMSQEEKYNFGEIIVISHSEQDKLHAFSPQANYTERATGACRRS
jgi:hypothetical protein